MSTVLLHVGQAGNQIGQELWTLLLEESPMKEDIFFDKFTNKARAVLVDSEPKVVKHIMEDKNISFIFDQQNLQYTQSGRGNNWALGYSATYREPTDPHIGAGADESMPLYERALEALRKEAEKADYFLGVMLVHSLAGGTGSGLGSRLIESYRDTFGKAYLATTSVWPHSSGETPLQHYNTCFSMSRLQENADAVLLFQNETIMKTLSKLITLKSTAQGHKDHHAINMASAVTMKNLNESIVTVLRHVMQPQKEEKFDFSELMNLACMPAYKMLEAHTNPLLFNRHMCYAGEKSWSAVVDGALSQVQLPATQEPLFRPIPKPSKPPGTAIPTSKFIPKEEHKEDTQQAIADSKKREGVKRFEEWFEGEMAGPQKVEAFSQLEKQHQTICTTAYFKGIDATEEISRTQPTYKSFRDRLTQRFKTVNWNPASESTTVRIIEEAPFRRFDCTRSATVIGNRTSISLPIRKLLDTSIQKFHAKAYLHWYSQYGIEKDDFLHTFESLRGVIDAYESALL
ncbi:hypothetical protein FGO68_gene6345 [Halteria grandinella]|uniref:Tubulin delta chain n=1 Tax=Halteria grandinella TaxID=5974 RepID=A0A8J8NQ51_HALGN|nr:hypothetical protein FGO68_gene6345 [Halteria grandinella]